MIWPSGMTYVPMVGAIALGIVGAAMIAIAWALGRKK